MPDLSADPFLRNVPVHLGFKVLPPVVLYDRIGEGAMGNVYQGWHFNLDIEVAVKCLKPELVAQNVEYTARFQREAKVAAQIAQENLVRVYDTLEAFGQCYTVMEFVDGENVENRISRRGRSTVGEALMVTIAVARALAALHRRRVIHRDVKPANILITRDGHVKLADLGIAKDASGSDSLRTHTQTVIGTPQYMSPEQFESSTSVTDKADVYAAGATLAFMLTGNHVIRGETLNQLMKRVIVDGFPDILDICPDLLPEVVALVRYCTARDPEHRPDADTLCRKASALLHQCGGEVSLADERAATSYGSTKVPTRLDRTRLREIRASVTQHPAQNPSGVIPPTLLPTDNGIGSIWPPARPQTPTATPGVPEPRRSSPALKIVAALGVLTLLLLLAATAAGYSYWTRTPAFLWQGQAGPKPTPTTQPSPAAVAFLPPEPAALPEPKKTEPKPAPLPATMPPEDLPIARPNASPPASKPIPDTSRGFVPTSVPTPPPTQVAPPDPKIALAAAFKERVARLKTQTQNRLWTSSLETMRELTQSQLADPDDVPRVIEESNNALEKLYRLYPAAADREHAVPNLVNKLRPIAAYGSSTAAMMLIESLVPWEPSLRNIDRLKDHSLEQTAIFNEAAAWAKMAADDPIAPQDEACVYIGEIYLKYAPVAAGRQNVAFKYLKQGSDHGNVNSMARLGAGQYLWTMNEAAAQHLPTSDEHIAPKLAEARQLMEQAAQRGSAFAAYNCGTIDCATANSLPEGPAKKRIGQRGEQLVAQAARAKFPAAVEFCERNHISY